MSAHRPSPIALALLALLYERPMHPYLMQKLIKERAKDEVINVRQRASLYQAIRRLLREELIRVRGVEGEGNLPERTVYELTEKGRETIAAWMREMIGRPVYEFPRFPAALAHLPLLSREEAIRQLKRRERTLKQEKGRLEAGLRTSGELVPRLFLLETEYLVAMLQAEIDWLHRLIDDLAARAIDWDEESLGTLVEKLSPKEQE